MSKDLIAVLKERLKQNYEAYIQPFLSKTPAELIESAPKIAEMRFVLEQLPQNCTTDDAKRLLCFENPLEVARSIWEGYRNYDYSDDFEYLLWQLQDKESDYREDYAVNDKGKVTVYQITTDDLRHMADREGLILQGCGGDLQEWVDSINNLLTEAGILLEGSKFEDVQSFKHEGLTNLLFPFEGVQLDMGKLAIWRIQTHDQFGGTWLSDYVPNKLGGFIHKPPKQKPTMSLLGMDGNIFVILGRASTLLKEAGQENLVSHMTQRVTICGDYYKALNIISEYVETELSPKPAQQKSQKKKGKDAYER